MSKVTVVCGAGGFIGGHLTKDLIEQGIPVRAIDLKPLEEWYQVSPLADNVVANLQEIEACRTAVANASVVYNLAADMGGMGFIENNKALCMLSVLINTHLLMAAREAEVSDYFYASSACVYNADKQLSPEVIPLKEEDAYPADPQDVALIAPHPWRRRLVQRDAVEHDLASLGR